jgi:hypothetical protein
MLERREALLREKLEAASDSLNAAQARYDVALADLAHVKAVQAARVGDYLTYIVRGVAGGGHVIGIDGESFIMMSGPVDARDIRRVNARYITGVQYE